MWVVILALFFAYLAIAGSILPGKVVPGATLPDGSRLHYRCNGLLSLLLLIGLLGFGAKMDFVSLTAISDRGFEVLSTTFLFSVLVTLELYAAGCKSSNRGSSVKPHVTGNLLHDWWFGIQLNPQFMGIDLNWNDGLAFYQPFGSCEKYPRWHLESINDPLPVVLCVIHPGLLFSRGVHDLHWDIIAERLGFMLVFGDLGWWLLSNNVELGTAAVVANCLTFLIGGANKQKHVFKKNPKAPIWGRPARVIGGKLLASGYWGIARNCNYLGDLLLALSFSLPCGISSPVPYFYPIYLLILLIWRERRDEARCAEKYKEIWAEYRRLVPWRILPYVY
ncbi:Ergosterol biosynthesis ERG4/ERG24 family [Prunus dulcis]|uniref:Delta(14)-sterol reductase n=1 Tax=Prunus dulcis TaxID=3755 RepID=A0A4Y1RYL0_PRUDU|nr:Ergosterol biosynthesis ERG4/ERG24 family [Prunus dulcis]